MFLTQKTEYSIVKIDISREVLDFSAFVFSTVLIAILGRIDMSFNLKATIEKRNFIFSKKGYIPWQPEFEKFGTKYNNSIQAPDNLLSGIIADFYEIENADFAEKSLLTIPDGCTDFMFAFDGHKLRSYISTGVKENKKFFFGDIKTLFGVRFMPGSTYHIFKDPIKDMVHHPVYLDSVLKNVNDLSDKFLECQTFQDRTSLLSDFILSNLCWEDSKCEIITNLTNLIFHKRGNIRIEEMSSQLGYSTRYIQDVCNEYIGMPPKEFCQTVRMQYALILEQKNPQASLETIASFAGYADVSHMNREFKKYMFCRMSDIRQDKVNKYEKKAEQIIFSRN